MNSKTTLRAIAAALALMLMAMSLSAFAAMTSNQSVRLPHSDTRTEVNSPEVEIVSRRTGDVKSSEIWDGSIASGFAGGTGTENDPYLISNGSQLVYLAQQVNDGNLFEEQYIKLTADIYLNDTTDWESWENGVVPANEWTPIGYYDVSSQFSGMFDGNGYAVWGVYINRPGENDANRYLVLFGVVSGASIANLGVEHSYINGYIGVGGVVGSSSYSEYNVVINCYNAGIVNGDSDVGGVVGLGSGIVANSYNNGIVSGNGSDIGGVVGSSGYGDSVTNCYNIGTVIGNESIDIGGVVGIGENVTNCYNTGNVIGNESRGVGGVVGFGGNVTN